MSDYSLFEEATELKQSEKEIRHVFEHLVSTLCNQKWKIVEQITEWSTTLMRQIQDHVNDQRKLLDQVYEQKVSYLDTIRDQCLRQALLYEQRNEMEDINQLINQCNTFKVDVAMLVYIQRPIISIQLITEDQWLQVNEKECAEEEEEECRTRLIENHEVNINNNSNATASSPPKVTLVNTEAISLLPSITESDNYEDEPLFNNHDCKNSVHGHHILMEKCPICYMIFPKSMTACDRNLHINEHYRDD